MEERMIRWPPAHLLARHEYDFHMFQEVANACSMNSLATKIPAMLLSKRGYSELNSYMWVPQRLKGQLFRIVIGRSKEVLRGPDKSSMSGSERSLYSRTFAMRTNIRIR